MENNNNKVIFIIAIIIVILVTLIAVLYINKVKPAPVPATDYDIKVYKSHVNTNTESGHSYAECSIDPSAKALLIAEFKKINALSSSNEVSGYSINGTYRVDYNDTLIAFDDAKSGLVYIGEKDAIYLYNSPMYEKIISYCGE